MEAVDSSALFDTHCHLDAIEFDPIRDRYVTEAIKANVQYMLAPAIGGHANFLKLASLQKCYGILLALGLHPLYASHFNEKDLIDLESTIQIIKPIAIGEIGLDNWQHPTNLSHQISLFSAQITLAKDYNLPVVLHARGAIDLVLMHLRQASLLGGIVHAFNGSEQQAKQFIHLGFKLGFGSTITYPNAHHIHRLITQLPADVFVLETDAPYMKPVWQNTVLPNNIEQYAQAIATLRNQSMDEIIGQSTLNAFEALHIKGQHRSTLKAATKPA